MKKLKAKILCTPLFQNSTIPSLCRILCFFFTLAFLFFTLPGCPTEPPIDNTPPGRRDYVWAVDTISSPPNLFYLFALWGSSPTNLWAVGPADETINSLWHFDGNTWSRTTQRLSSNLVSIYGFDSSNIWICDSPGGNIFKYDGQRWNKIGFFPYPEYSLTYLNNVWGISQNEIYIAGAAYDQAKGSKAILMRHNGANWNFVELPNTEVSFIWVRKDLEDENLYFTAVKNLPTGDTNKIFRFNGNDLIQIWSGTEVATVNEMNGEIYLAIGKKICKYQSNSLKVWKDFSNTTYLGRVWGRNKSDFFGVASDGLAHYNGTDLKTIYPTNLFINDLFVMEKDIFMLCENRIIIHGRLSNYK